MTMNGVPYWRLAGFYFFYFAVVGIISPYWGLYLDQLGFSPGEIGVLVALPMLTRILAPNIWGWLTDRTGRYLFIIRLGALGAVLAFIGVLVRTDYWGLLLFTALFTFFWNAVLPQFEVVTLDALGDNTHNYSRIRLWGSIGFIMTVVGLGFAFDTFSVAVLPWVLWCFLIFIAVATFSVPTVPHRRHTLTEHSLGDTLRQRKVLYFLVAALLLHLSHGVYYGFFSLFMAKHGFSGAAIGGMWAIGVVAEIVIFLKAPAILSRFTLRQCYLLSIFAAIVRWWLIGQFPTHVSLILFAQILHALTFGLAHAVAIEFVRTAFGQASQGKGQALYSAFCFGGGGALGAYLSGQIWSFSPAACFMFAASAAALSWIVAYWGMKTRPILSE